MDGDDFDREMADAEWAEVYQRQRERGALVEQVVRILGLSADSTVLEVGSGPGYPATQLARHAGQVIAIDQHIEALKFCRSRVRDERLENVHCLAMDAAASGVCFDRPVSVLVGFVLHHTDAPLAVLSEIGGVVPLDSRVIVLEYHPDDPGDVGPPLDHRIHPDSVREWLTDAGFPGGTLHRFPEEKYGVSAVRADP